jgi:hypothetical protein
MYQRSGEVTDPRRPAMRRTPPPNLMALPNQAIAHRPTVTIDSSRCRMWFVRFRNTTTCFRQSLQRPLFSSTAIGLQVLTDPRPIGSHPPENLSAWRRKRPAPIGSGSQTRLTWPLRRIALPSGDAPRRPQRSMRNDLSPNPDARSSTHAHVTCVPQAVTRPARISHQRRVFPRQRTEEMV